MNCKNCGISLANVVAVETTAQIRVICQGVGGDGAALESMVELYAPLCRRCIQHWGAGEDDLVVPRVVAAKKFRDWIPD
jgi:hypothetical protein